MIYFHVEAKSDTIPIVSNSVERVGPELGKQNSHSFSYSFISKERIQYGHFANRAPSPQLRCLEEGIRQRPRQPKAVLIAALGASRAELESVVSQVPLERITEPGACGSWSVKDVLAHLAV